MISNFAIAFFLKRRNAFRVRSACLFKFTKLIKPVLLSCFYLISLFFNCIFKKILFVDFLKMLDNEMSYCNLSPEKASGIQGAVQSGP